MNTTSFIVIVLASAAVTCLSPSRAAEPEVFVAPDGSNANPGTKDMPFATLTKARDAMRARATTRPRRIVVRGGAYYGVTVELGPQDSGLTIEAAEGESPVLYGGKRIAGWEKDGENFYAAKVPGAKDRKWDFRLLVVNDQMRPRARFPKGGNLKYLTRFEAPWHNTSGGMFRGADKPELKVSLQYKKADLGGWLDVNNAELTLYHVWDDSIVGLKSHDVETQTLHFSNASFWPPGAFGKQDYAVWNIREGMTRPGQWYLDRTRELLVYWPLPGEDMSRVQAIAPMTECAVRIEGTRDSPVTGMTLKGLGISATTTPCKSAGGFGAPSFLGAVEAQFLSNCHFLGLRIENVGGQGLRLTECAGCTVDGCEVTGAGAGGIYAFKGVGNRIVSNRIAGVGRTYASAIGMTVGGGGMKMPDILANRDNEASNNEVCDTPYVGVCFDGLRNRFERNLVHGVMKVLDDGGAFYGGGMEIVLRGNLVRDVPRNKRAYAYYIDELGENCLVEGNVAVDVATPTHNHMAARNTYRNNLFANTRGGVTLRFPKSRGYTLDRNIVWAADGVGVENAPAIGAWTNNLFFSAKGVYGKEIPADVQRADPLFEDVAKGDFRFKPDSPAMKLGFKPLDLSNVGPPKKDASPMTRTPTTAPASQPA